MNKIIFAFVGSLGIMGWLFLGRLLIRDSRITSRKFGVTVGIYISILELILFLISDTSEIPNFVLGAILAVITLIVAYPIAYYSFPLLKKWYERPKLK